MTQLKTLVTRSRGIGILADALWLELGPSGVVDHVTHAKFLGNR